MNPEWHSHLKLPSVLTHTCWQSWLRALHSSRSKRKREFKQIYFVKCGLWTKGMIFYALRDILQFRSPLLFYTNVDFQIFSMVSLKDIWELKCFFKLFEFNQFFPSRDGKVPRLTSVKPTSAKDTFLKELFRFAWDFHNQFYRFLTCHTKSCCCRSTPRRIWRNATIHALVRKIHVTNYQGATGQDPESIRRGDGLVTVLSCCPRDMRCWMTSCFAVKDSGFALSYC